MNNPYYVKQGQGWGPGLQGLGQKISGAHDKYQAQQSEEEQTAKLEELKRGALEAYRSGDTEKMREFGILHPEMSDIVEKAMGHKTEETKQNYIDTMVGAIKNPEEALGFYKKRKQMLIDQGVTAEGMKKTNLVINKLNSDPEEAIKDIRMELAMIAPKISGSVEKVMGGDKKDVGKLPTTAMGQFIKQNPDATSEDLINFTNDLKVSKNTDKYNGLTGAYKNWLIANEKESSPENFKKFQENKVKMAELSRKQSTKRPEIARLMADGWVPSQRMTEPMLDAYEAAAAKSQSNGKPLTVDDMYAYEFQAKKNAATGRTSGSRLVIARKQNIEAANSLLTDMKKTAKKLNYPGVKFIGALQKHLKGQLNDPVFTEYMTQRADSLFILGNALKQNGLTDKSIEVEEEAFSPTLTPEAFDAWYNVQLRALNRAAEEMNTDYKFGISTSPVFPAGQGGAPTPENPKPEIEPGNPTQSNKQEPQSLDNFWE